MTATVVVTPSASESYDGQSQPAVDPGWNRDETAHRAARHRRSAITATATQLVEVVTNEAVTSARKARDSSMDGVIAGEGECVGPATHRERDRDAAGQSWQSGPGGRNQSAHHDEVEVQLPDSAGCLHP
jgi:hypothetical protein